MHKAKKLPEQAYLRECFRYDPDTGDLWWLERPSSHFKTRYDWHRMNYMHMGKPVGSGKRRGGGVTTRRYKSVGLDGAEYQAHRLIWKYVHGEEPDYIDHINGDKHDNRIENLRNVDNAENLRNRAVSRNNNSGVMGVIWQKKIGRWVAYMHVKGKYKHIGCHTDFFEAVCARKSAERKHGFHINHGRAA